jgi:hypothetical protein
MTASEPSSPDNDRQEQGLWLWHGEAPAQSEALPPIQPLSRIKRMTHLLVSAAQRSMRLALNGPALIGLALIGSAAWAMLYLLPSGEPVPGDTPIVAAPTVRSLGGVRPARPVPFGRYAYRAAGPGSAAAGCDCQNGGSANRTQNSQIASLAQIAARKKGARRLRPPTSTRIFGTLPLSVRLGRVNYMAWGRLLTQRRAHTCRLLRRVSVIKASPVG